MQEKLESSLSSIKNRYEERIEQEINTYLYLKRDIENAYNKALEDNKTILSLLKSMFNAYDKDRLNYCTISNLNRNVNLYMPYFQEEEHDSFFMVVSKLIHYYDNYCMIKQKRRDLTKLFTISQLMKWSIK